MPIVILIVSGSISKPGQEEEPLSKPASKGKKSFFIVLNSWLWVDDKVHKISIQLRAAVKMKQYGYHGLLLRCSKRKVWLMAWDCDKSGRLLLL